MPRPPAAVKGVYQRDDDPSGAWYARIRVNGRLVKKSFGNDRAAAIDYVDKARAVRRTGDGVLPRNARQMPKSTQEIVASSDVSVVLARRTL